MRRSWWNASNSRKASRKPPDGPARSRGRPSRACDESSAPILLCLALHRRCIRVLHFEPIGRAAGTIGRILALRHDAFEAELAGMGKDGWTVALDMLVEPDAGASLGMSQCFRKIARLTLWDSIGAS